MRTATADELGDEVVADCVDDAGDLTGGQSALRPDPLHASVAEHDADAVIEGAVCAAECGERELCATADEAAANEEEGAADEAED